MSFFVGSDGARRGRTAAADAAVYSEPSWNEKHPKATEITSDWATSFYPHVPDVRASTDPSAHPVLEDMIASDIHPGSHQDVPRFEYDPVDGGTLVYLVRREAREHVDEPVETGRRLYGFADVTDWDAVRSELVRRGHDVGAVHHLPHLEGGA